MRCVYYFKFGFLLFLVSCLPYKIPTANFVQKCEHENLKSQTEIASRSSLYWFIPRHRTQIYPLDMGHWTLWTLFGNDDDGIFGEGEHANYKPNCRPSFGKALVWWFRNPLHNFCFYVIGSADKPNSCKEFKRSVGAFDIELSLHGGKPFLQIDSFSPAARKSTFYLGWRERGNFGLKLHLLKKIKPNVE